jgi:hypothetical protein
MTLFFALIAIEWHRKVTRPMLKFLKKNAKSLLLAGSLLLNALGASGVIPPVLAKAGAAILEAAR